MKRLFRSFRRDDKAAVAVEFALVSGALILTILFVLLISVILFVGQSLDYAADKAARQVMTGAVQTGNVTQTAFLTNIVCPLLPSVMSCSNVIVNLYTVTEASQPNGYYTYTNNGSGSSLTIPALSNTSSQYSPGIQGQYEYLLIVYPITFIPAAFASMLGTYTFNGQPAFVVVSTAAFRNEQY